jgi:hypothetical protein
MTAEEATKRVADHVGEPEEPGTDRSSATRLASSGRGTSHVNRPLRLSIKHLARDHDGPADRRRLWFAATT